MRVTDTEELLQLLDGLSQRADATSRAASTHWDRVLQRDGHPLAVDLPDINLMTWRATGLLTLDGARSALDVGCGLGRNSRWRARAGLSVTAVDIASGALDVARQGSDGHPIDYLDLDFLREAVPGAPFDLVYDSGCFHHLVPHRRISYLAALRASLAPGGWFGICAFTAGLMGSDAPDDELIRSGQVGDGVGYTEAELESMFGWLELVDVGPMPAPDVSPTPAFSQPFLTVALFRRASSS